MKKTSADYINSFDFEYCRTYSFQRTEAPMTSKELDEVRTQEQNRIPGKQIQSPYLERILDTEGNLNQTAVMIREIDKSDGAYTTLSDYLKTEIEEEILFLCAPIYRDAILFYNAKHDLVEGINICFECDRIESIYGAHISTDFKTFKYLKQLLLQLGHSIEYPEEFKADDILATMQKNKKDKK